MIVTVIGTGLIGGSMALDLKKRKKASKVIGVDNSTEHLEKAKEMGIIDDVLSLEEAIPVSPWITHRKYSKMY